MALLVGVLLPALGQARRAARALVGGSRQRQIVLAVSLYAGDHEGRYPESVATATLLGRTWRWQEPRMLKACQPRAAGYRASLAGYLCAYLPRAVILSCPSSPRPYPYLEQAWQAGEQWDNPHTSFTDDSVLGSFCLYWNYVGHLTEQQRPFRGPQTDYGRPGCSGLLISDYFGFNHWRSPDAFGSCEPLPDADITTETHEATTYWFRPRPGPPDRTGVPPVETRNLASPRLQAGFVDGHVESYRPRETAILEVAESLDGATPALSGFGLGAGLFYLPQKAVASRP